MDKIEEIYDSYANIIKGFGIDEIKEAYANINKAYEDFLISQDLLNKVKVNNFILAHALMDYFTDIDRLKEFHHIHSHNSYKRHAYQMSWLLRRKPLQVMQDELEELVYINEKFVLSYTMDFLTRDMENNFYDKLSDEQRAVIDGYMKSLYYHLKYRNCSAQVLELSLLSFEAGAFIK